MSNPKQWWLCLPTAGIHFIWVELRHVYLAVFAWQRLLVGISTRVYLRNHQAVDTTSEIETYFFDKYCFGQVAARNVTLGAEPVLMLHDKTEVSGYGVLWMIVAWILPLGAICLLLYALGSFAKMRIWSFESGRYLHFTWHFVRTEAYRLLVGVMASAPCLLMIIWFFGAYFYPKSSDSYQNNFVIMQESLLSIVILLFSLNLLAYPSIPVHHWDQEEMERLNFKRGLFHLLLGSNGNFGLKLTDALWTARFELQIHGHLRGSRLLRYFRTIEEAELALEICQKAQHNEVELHAPDRASSS